VTGAWIVFVVVGLGAVLAARLLDERDRRT
jgi:hypothetical protein